MYTIGEMARMLHIAPSTLRYDDKEGLLPFVERSGSGIRRFKDSDLPWLSMISCLKQTGMPIKEIKTFIDLCRTGDETIHARLELIRRQQAVVADQIAQLQATQQMLATRSGTTSPPRKQGPARSMRSCGRRMFPRHFEHSAG